MRSTSIQILAVVVLLLIGCQAESSGVVEASGEAVEAAPRLATSPPLAPTATAIPAAAITDVAPFDAVLIELFATADTEAYRASLDDVASELAIACMAEAGFELQITPEPTFVPPDPNDIEAAQTMGFGIVAEFEHRIEILQQSLVPDPNLPYLETLTEAELQEFFRTLDGTPAPAGQQQTDTGCNGSAAAEALADWERFSMMLPNYGVLGEELDTHPRWVEASAQWQACMAERDLLYADPAAVRSDVLTRMRTLVNESFPDSQVPLVEIDGEAVFDPQAEVLLADLVTFEQDAAVASIECRAPLASEFEAAEFAVQQAFVDRNQDAINELLG